MLETLTYDEVLVMTERKKPTLLGRTVTLIGTLGVIALAGGAVVIGADTLGQRAEAAPVPTPAEITPVAARALQFANSYSTTRQFLGQVEATAQATLSFELSGRLSTLTVDEGDFVAEGDVLARLDTALIEAEVDRLNASRAALEAQLVFAESRLVRATELQGDGFSSQETLDQARATRDELIARLAEVDATLTTTEINLEKSVLLAPFDGRVGTQTAEETETVNPGQAILTLLETTTPRVRIGLPLNLSPETVEDATIVIDGVTYAASLDQVRPDIDPVTRTRTALFTVNDAPALTFGQTATLFVETQVATRGVWVPTDALQEGIGSVWTVLVVEDDIVRIAAVELLHTEANRAYVRGSFSEGAALIHTGAHRVVPGQRVSIMLAEG